MSNKIVYLLLPLLMLSSCGDETPEQEVTKEEQKEVVKEEAPTIRPRELNNRLTLAQNNVHQSLLRFWDGETDSLRRVYFKDFQFELEIQQSNVNEITPTRKYGREFYTSIQNYFEFLKTSESEFNQFIELSNSEEETKQLDQLVNEITSQYNVYLDSISHYQELFTSSNKVLLN